MTVFTDDKTDKVLKKAHFKSTAYTKHKASAYRLSSTLMDSPVAL